jgi:hypothetical protein
MRRFANFREAPLLWCNQVVLLILAAIAAEFCFSGLPSFPEVRYPFSRRPFRIFKMKEPRTSNF